MRIDELVWTHLLDIHASYRRQQHLTVHWFEEDPVDVQSAALDHLEYVPVT